jgi:hypothetical protein
MIAESLQPRRPRWRFSLKWLFILTALAAILTWLHTRLSRQDDLIYLELLGLSIVAGTTWSRLGGRGVVLATVLGAILPVIGSSAFHYFMFHARRMVVQVEAFDRIAILVAAFVAATTAATSTLALTSYIQLPAAHQRRIKRIGVIAAAFILITAGGYSIHRQATIWRPILTIRMQQVNVTHPAAPPLAFTPDGSLLVILDSEMPGVPGKLRMWDLASGAERPAFDIKTGVLSLCLTTDGRQVALTHVTGISIYDTQTRRLVRTIDVNTANPWISRNCCYSPDGARLALCSFDGAVYKVYVWDTADGALRSERVLENVAQPEMMGDDLVLVAYSLGTLGDVSIVDAETLEPHFPPQAAHRAYRVSFAGPERHIAFGSQYLDFQSGERQDLPAPVYAWTSGGRRFVTCRSNIKGYALERLPDWRLGLPVVRHWWVSRMSAIEFVLLDTTTHQEICSTANYRSEYLFDAYASAHGSAVAGIYGRGPTVRVWRVPD